MKTYVALGDSFTAGTGCAPGESWADLLAEAIAGDDGVIYENLAEHGATSADVRRQVSRAIELEPDLVTVVCGTNDLLLRSGDVDDYSRNLGAILHTLTSFRPDAMIVTATAPDRWEFLSLGPRTQARFEAELHALNTATRAVASLYGAEVLDVAGHPGLSRQENFAGDGLHPSHLGHRRAADGFKALVADRYPTRLREESLR
jgi:phosphatidylinositol alpha 1,6-mannosyltransferase